MSARGLTRRLRRGWWGYRPEGAVLSFEAKESTKESTRHGDSRGGPPRCASRASACGSPFGAVLGLGSLRSPAGKKASIAHFAGGARNVARIKVGELSPSFVRARAHSFPLSKRARLFPSAAYRRSASPPHGWGESQIAQVGIFPRGVAAFARRVSKSCWPVARAGGPVARRWSAYANKRETASDRRAARPVAERRHWGRKRRKREVLCRAFPKRNT